MLCLPSLCVFIMQKPRAVVSPHLLVMPSIHTRSAFILNTLDRLEPGRRFREDTAAHQLIDVHLGDAALPIFRHCATR